MTDTSAVRYGELNAQWDLTLDVDRARRASEDTLIARSHDGTPGDRGMLEQPSSGLDYFSSPKPTSVSHTVGVVPRLRKLLVQTTLFLLPSFISSYFTPSPLKPATLSPTAWLDGLRGIACLVVVLHHYTYAYAKELEQPYDGAHHIGILQLPIIKLLHHGPPMVKIFYIISGFALTVKAVKITRVPGKNFDLGALMTNLSTSIWKRYLRLYIPCAASFILCAFLLSMGMFDVFPYETHPKWITGYVERRPPTMDNIFQQIGYAVWDFYQFGVEVTFFGLSDGKFKTDNHLWTIPVEFKCSIQLFVFVAGGCVIQRWLRVYILTPMIFSFILYNRRWPLSLFLFGYFLGELHSDLLAGRNSTTLPTNRQTEKPAPRKSILKTILQGSLLLFGLWMISYPVRMQLSNDTTSYGFLIPLTPAKYPIGGGKRFDHTHDFWQAIGSMIVVWVIMYMPRLQNLVLCNRPVQYLGKISFALYVMHGPVQRTIGYWLVRALLTAAGLWRFSDSRQQWELVSGHDQLHNSCLVTGFLLILAMTIWWSDVFWRGVDMQSVRFLRWLETKLKR